jgi:hypothetical protein
LNEPLPDYGSSLFDSNNFSIVIHDIPAEEASSIEETECEDIDRCSV